MPTPPRLLERLREALRTRHLSARTEEAYIRWTKRFVRYHGMRHPGEMGEREVAEYLTYLAVSERWSRPVQDWVSALNQPSIVFEGWIPG